MDRASIETALARYVGSLEAAAHPAPATCDDLLSRARQLNVRWLRGETLPILQGELRTEWKRLMQMDTLPAALTFELGKFFANLCHEAGVALFPAEQPRSSEPSDN